MYTTTSSPSISVVQGAYDLFCVQGDQARQEFSSETVAPVFNARQSVSMVEIGGNPLTETWLRFQDLVQEWKAQSRAISSITEEVMCPAYQKIIGMGERAVPFLLQQLRDEGSEPDQWFWALSAITRVNPVNDADRGDYASMARAWLEWGKNEGHVW